MEDTYTIDLSFDPSVIMNMFVENQSMLISLGVVVYLVLGVLTTMLYNKVSLEPQDIVPKGITNLLVLMWPLLALFMTLIFSIMGVWKLLQGTNTLMNYLALPDKQQKK